MPSQARLCHQLIFTLRRFLWHSFTTNLGYFYAKGASKSRVNAMSWNTTYDDITDTVQNDAKRLNMACQQRFGVSGLMFRVIKFLFYICVLAFTVSLIEIVGVNSMIAIAVAVTLISGPEGVELYLIRQDVLPKRDTSE